MTSEFGAWPLPEENKPYQYHKMDRWEDMQRRRMRMVKNPVGTAHPEATLRPGSAEGKYMIKVFRTFKQVRAGQKVIDITNGWKNVRKMKNS